MLVIIRKIATIGVALGFALLCSCSGVDVDTQTSNTQTSNTANLEPYGKYDPPIEIKTVGFANTPRQYPAGDDIDNNVWTRAYLDELGIKLTYDWFADGWDNFEQKLNVAIASGSLPDVFEVPRERFFRLAEADMLSDLGQYYDVCLPEIKGILEDDGVTMDILKYDGKMVGYANPRGINIQLLWYRADWLQNLGLDVPTTIDEVIEVARAFTFNDPDQNGKDDTLGLPIDQTLEQLIPFAAAYNAYMDTWMDNGNNELVFGTIQPEVKTALLSLNKMYSDGLLDREFAVKNRSAVYTDVGAGKFGLFYGQHYAPLSPLNISKSNDPNAQWECMPLPSTEKGEIAKTPQSIVPSMYFVVRKGFSNPEALFKMSNLAYKHLHSEQSELKYHTSEDGVSVFNYAYATVADPGFAAKKKLADSLNQAVASDKSFEDTNLSDLNRGTWEVMKSYKDGDQSGWGMWTVYREGGGVLTCYDALLKDAYILSAFIGPNGDAFSEKGPNLYKLQQEIFTKIIMGANSPSSFEVFVDDWHRMGGEGIIEEVNQWYLAN